MLLSGIGETSDDGNRHARKKEFDTRFPGIPDQRNEAGVKRLSFNNNLAEID